MAARALNPDDYTDEVFALKVGGTTVKDAVRAFARELLPVFQEVWGEDAVSVILTRGLATGDSTFY